MDSCTDVSTAGTVFGIVSRFSLQILSRCSQCGAFVIPATDESALILTTATGTRACIAKLSDSNRPPLASELSLIQPLIANNSARLSVLDAEISAVKDRLRQLEAERAVLSRYHAQSISILSPMRRIPPEILGEIFSWTLPSAHEVLRAEKCPWVLTHVCSRWRAVALSIPSLWSLIVIDFSVKPQYSPEMISTQMKRAGSLKIHFYAYEDGDSRYQVALFQLLAEHCDRWEELNIQLSSHLVPYVTVHDHFPVLRRAMVEWDTAESQTPEFTSVDFFHRTTGLVDIGVYSAFRFLPTLLPALPHLTRYDFDAPWKVHNVLLKSLPNLQEVRILCDFDEPADWLEPVGDTIDLQRLQRLYVTHHTRLDFFRAPSLDRIAIELCMAENTEVCGSLERLITRSSCSPRSLCIQGALDVPSMAAFLQKYPSFTEFAVTDEDEEDKDIQREIVSAFLALFTISNSNPSGMLPHITKIGFASYNADATFIPPFLDMLDSRWKVGKCVLKAAELLFLDIKLGCIDPDPQSAARITTLRGDGLGIAWFSGHVANSRTDRWLFKPEWA
ncbi:F-box domain-containing protein [Mycena sanguinolenta]|uniref:F-box domain-containing protein n=1 Tax=Mycena sanguinolenta TaxID=230812 RepID=A0A8H6X9N7_9AGAR|nr:F-box domain-containing protein [Mycena sanguinolenta]